MTVSAESFLVLEKSLATRLTNAWNRDTAATKVAIISAVNEGDFVTAVELCDDLGLGPAAERNRKFAEFVGMQAALFGASRLTSGDPRRTHFMDQARPEEIEQATQILLDTLDENATEALCRHAQILLTRERADQQDATFKSERVRKAATAGFIRSFSSSVQSNGVASVNLGSSLHNSRLGAWGFTQEAQFRGIKKYQVNEQLDSRTCPVCQAMHGRTFWVDQAATKLAGWLGTTKPNDLKAIAPWPKQDRKSVKLMRQMSRTQLAEKGWDTPPYHPLCRGILVESGAIPAKLPDPVEPARGNLDAAGRELIPEPEVTEVAQAAITQTDIDEAFQFVGSRSDTAVNTFENSVKVNFQDSFKGDVTGINERIGYNQLTAFQLSVEESVLINKYTGGHFIDINAGLRMPGNLPKVKAEQLGSLVKVVNSGLDQLPARAGKTFRGIEDVNQELFEKLRDKYIPGTVVTEEAYLSTAVSKRGAFSGQVNYVIEGHSGRSIEPFSSFKNETEVLYKPGTQFKVLDVKVKERGMGSVENALTIVLQEIEAVTKEAELNADQKRIVEDSFALVEEEQDRAKKDRLVGSPQWKKKTQDPIGVV